MKIYFRSLLFVFQVAPFVLYCSPRRNFIKWTTGDEIGGVRIFWTGGAVSRKSIFREKFLWEIVKKNKDCFCFVCYYLDKQEFSFGIQTGSNFQTFG